MWQIQLLKISSNSSPLRYLTIQYTDILNGIVKLLDEVCVSHTKQIRDNKTVCTTQEVHKMLLIGLSL